MIPDVSLPYDILKPGIRTTPVRFQPAFLYGSRKYQRHDTRLWQCPGTYSETEPAFFVHQMSRFAIVIF